MREFDNLSEEHHAAIQAGADQATAEMRERFREIFGREATKSELAAFNIGFSTGMTGCLSATIETFERMGISPE